MFDKNLVSITVDEAPIIDKIFLNGIKAKKIEQKIKDDLILKSRSSYNEFQLSQDVNNIDVNTKIS